MFTIIQQKGHYPIILITVTRKASDKFMRKMTCDWENVSVGVEFMRLLMVLEERITIHFLLYKLQYTKTC